MCGCRLRFMASVVAAWLPRAAAAFALFAYVTGPVNRAALRSRTPGRLPPACGSLRLSHSLAECVVCAGRAGLRRMPMRRGAVRTRRGDATRSSSN